MESKKLSFVVKMVELYNPKTVLVSFDDHFVYLSSQFPDVKFSKEAGDKKFDLAFGNTGNYKTLMRVVKPGRPVFVV